MTPSSALARNSTFVLVALILAFLLWYYFMLESAVRVTFRLTVEANDGPGISSSSGIYKVTIRPSYAPNGAMIVEVSGDAIFIKRNNADDLVVMMSNDPTATDETTFGVLPFIAIWGTRYYHYNEIIARREKLTGSSEVPLRQIPTIITLEKSGAPASAKRIWPSTDLSRARLEEIAPPPVRARIDIVEDGAVVSRTIHKHISWFEDISSVRVALASAGLRHPSPFQAFRR